MAWSCIPGVDEFAALQLKKFAVGVGVTLGFCYLDRLTPTLALIVAESYYCGATNIVDQSVVIVYLFDSAIYSSAKKLATILLPFNRKI